MTSMFAGAGSLTTLDLSSFDTSNVIAMNHMFQNTSSLRELTLGNNFSFVGNPSLPNITTTAEFNGYWRNTIL